MYREWREVADSFDPPRIVRRRGMGRDCRAAGRLPPRRRAAHRVRLRHGPCAVAGGCAASRPRRSSLAVARDGRRAGHVGAQQPRHPPPRQPLRTRPTAARRRRRRRLLRSGRHPRCARSAGGVPGRRSCSSSPCPARSTCTRARSWASRRSRTCPRIGPRRPDLGAVRTHPARARRLPCPDPVDDDGAVARIRRRQAVAPATGGVVGVVGGGPGRRPRLDAVALPRRVADPAFPSRASVGTTSELEWLDMGQEVIGFRRADGFTCIVNLSESDIELPAGDVVLSSVPVTDTIPSDATVWLDTDVTARPVSAPDRAATTERDIVREFTIVALASFGSCPPAPTSATWRSSPTSTTARPPWSTRCCTSRAPSAPTRSSPTG